MVCLVNARNDLLGFKSKLEKIWTDKSPAALTQLVQIYKLNLYNTEN